MSCDSHHMRLWRHNSSRRDSQPRRNDPPSETNSGGGSSFVSVFYRCFATMKRVVSDVVIAEPANALTGYFFSDSPVGTVNQ